jgi:hypothetical protein
MDPITAFAMAQAAIGAIRKGVAFYKEAKQAGKEVMDVAHEVGGHIGKFMDAAEIVKTAAEEQRKVVPKKGQAGLNSKALDNVLRAKQVQMAEEELREMLVYQSPPELGAVWTEFEIERKRLRELQEAQEAQEKLEEARKLKARRALMKKHRDAFIYVALGFLVFLLWLCSIFWVVQMRKEDYPEYGDGFIPRLQPDWRLKEVAQRRKELDERERKLKEQYSRTRNE